MSKIAEALRMELDGYQDRHKVSIALTAGEWKALIAIIAEHDAQPAAQLERTERERCAQVVESMMILPGRDFSAADAAEINGMGRAFAKVIRRGPNVGVQPPVLRSAGTTG